MLKKVIKYTLRALLVVLVVLILVPALLYIPAVQDFVRKRAVGYASRALGMDLSVERLRLSFPLRLSVDNTLLVDKADTLLSCGRLSLDVALWPLVRKEVVIRSFGLERVAARYKDSLAGMDMRLSAGLLSLDAAKADLSANTAGIASLVLSDADVRLDITQAAPKEEADSTAALPWTIGIGKLSVGNLAFGMRTAPAVSELSVRLAEGTVDECRVRLDSQQVSVKSVLLNRGGYSYLTGPAVPGKEKQEAAPAPGGSTPSLPWTVRVGSVVLTGNRAEYGLLNHRPAAGFDPSFIVLSTLDLVVDSIYNRGADIALQIRRMAFTERSGLTVSDMTGDIGMDASGISLAGVTLKTPFSRIEANISAGEGILALAPDSPLKAVLTADVNTKDLKYLYPALIPPVLDGRIVSLALTAAGTLGDIGKAGLDISSPGHVAFTADGAARNVLDPGRMEASARFEGDFRDMAFLEALLPDSALRRRIAIPDRIWLHGTAGADKGAFSAASTLSADGGEIALQGRLDTRSEAYGIELRCDSFPLNRFLPADSLGLLDLALQAGGSGFDPLRAQTRGNIRLQVNRAEFRGRDFGGVELNANLEEGQLSGRLSDRDEALRLLLLVSGTLTERKQEVWLTGNVFDFDLAELGISPQKIGGSFALEAGASASDAGSYTARIALDSIEVRTRHRTDRIRPTSLSLSSDTTATRAKLASGDLSLAFVSPGPVDSLVPALTRSADILARQIRAQSVDMEALKPALPDFSLSVTAGRENILNNFLKTKKVSFGALDIEGVNCDSLPVSLRIKAERLAWGGVVLDTLTAGIAQDGRRLDYFLRTANVPGNLDNVALAGLYGHVAGNRGQVNLCQKNRAGREGFRFGLDVEWNDSLVRAGVTPPDPVFGYEPWTVNPGNYLVYRYGKSIDADLDMRHGDQRFAIRTVPGEGASDDIRLDIAGLNIGSALGLLPSAPPVDGILGTDMTLGMTPDSLTLRGDLSIAELSYDKRRFGNVDFGLYYKQDQGHMADARLTLDGAEVLTVRGDYRAECESLLDLTATIPGFPLQQANVFLPDDLIRLRGRLQAKIHAGGTADRPRLDGGVHFAQTEIRVPMIGTSFRLSSDTIRIDDSRVIFDDYTLLAPNSKPLTIGGEVDLADFSRMTADLALRASDFQAVDVARKEGTSVYGKAYLDLDATAKGLLDELVVRGNVALLGGTDINYVMQDSPMDEGASAKHRDVRLVPGTGLPGTGRDIAGNTHRRHGRTGECRHQQRRTGGRRPFGGRQQPDRPEGRRQPDLYHESAGRRPPVGKICAFGRKRTLQSAHHLPKNLQDHAGQLCRMDREHRRPGFQHHGRGDRTCQCLLGRAGQPCGEFRHLHQHPQFARRPGGQLRTFGPRRPHHAEPVEFAHGRATRQSGYEPADIQHLHGPRNHGEGQLREPAQLVYPEGAEPVGAEQPEGRRPELRHQLLWRGRPQRPAHRLLLPVVQKPVQQPRARRHRRQVQHGRRPVAEPQGEPDRRHFAGIHADQARQHVPESIPPYRVRKHPRRRNHRNGRGLRDPEKTAEAGRPVQVDETQSEKTEAR